MSENTERHVRNGLYTVVKYKGPEVAIGIVERITGRECRQDEWLAHIQPKHFEALEIACDMALRAPPFTKDEVASCLTTFTTAVQGRLPSLVVVVVAADPATGEVYRMASADDEYVDRMLEQACGMERHPNAVVLSEEEVAPPSSHN